MLKSTEISIFAGKALANFTFSSKASCLLYFAITTPTIPARTHKDTFNHIIVQMFFSGISKRGEN